MKKNADLGEKLRLIPAISYLQDPISCECSLGKISMMKARLNQTSAHVPKTTRGLKLASTNRIPTAELSLVLCHFGSHALLSSG